MSSMIRELKNTVIEQNEVITSLKNEKAGVREALTGLYQALVRYKPKYTVGATAVEALAYPDIHSEDIVKKPTPEILRSVGRVFKTVVDSLTVNRTELTDIHKELDVEVENALQAWHTIRAQEGQAKQAEAFRDNLIAQASNQRPVTPEFTVDVKSPIRSTNGSGPAVHDSSNKKTKGQDSNNSKKGSGTTTLDKLFGTSTTPPKKSQSNGADATSPTTLKK